ncbi:MAG: hypothetical protein IJL74_01245 [Bacilli bacterium]|nr:hypothetical protein [Bacilli bacterium]
MGRFQLGHWSVYDNELRISLMRFFVSISIGQDENVTVFDLRVIDSNRTQFLFLFDTLEEAVCFTEEKIYNASSIYDVIDMYNELFISGKDNKQLLRS